MTKKHQKQKKNLIKYALLFVLLIAAGVISFFVAKSFFNKENTNKPDDGGKSQVVDGGKGGIEKVTPDQGQVTTEEGLEDKNIVQYDGDDPNASESLTGVITYSSINDGVLSIRVNIDQYLTEGTCNIYLTQNESTLYSDSVAIIDAASTSTCEGFDISLTEEMTGSIQILIDIFSGEKVGQIAGGVDL